MTAVNYDALLDGVFGPPQGGIDPRELVEEVIGADLTQYQHRFLDYLRDRLGFTPWAGINGHPGQREILLDIQDSVTRQLRGEKNVPNIFVIEAAHGLGKTYGIAAPVTCWFFDSFGPSCVVTTTAPSSRQVRQLLWKDIRTHRMNKGLPGSLMPAEPFMSRAANWFAEGVTTSNANNSGMERFQGQHNDYHAFVFDEAEGVPAFAYGAVPRMLTGNRVGLWVLIANPKTTTSRFQALKGHPMARVYRLSLRDFPNVWEGREVVPGGTTRETFNAWIEDHEEFGCDVVTDHDETAYTFTVPWSVPKRGGGEHPAGTIFRPKRGFLYGALGIPPASGSGDVFISAGRYDASLARDVSGPTDRVQIGVDCARYGDDSGKVYAYQGRVLTQVATIQGDASDTHTLTQTYKRDVLRALTAARAAGARQASVRVDGTGGFGSGIIDALKSDADLPGLFPAGFTVHEVMFGAQASEQAKYDNLVTELYAVADEVLKDARIEHPGKSLKRDLTERRYKIVQRGDQELRRLEPKNDFKKRSGGQSPDDGDGAVLALAPERLFAASPASTATGTLAAAQAALNALQSRR